MNTQLEENARRAFGELERELDTLAPGWPLAAYARNCLAGRHEDYCNTIPRAQLRMLRHLIERHGRAAGLVCNQAALLRLALSGLREPQSGSLPPAVATLRLRWLEQVCSDALQRVPAEYDLLQLRGNSRDDLLRDFAVCAGRAMPVGGAWIVECRRLRPTELFADSGRRSWRALDPAPAAGVKRLADIFGVRVPLRRVRDAMRCVLEPTDSYFVIHTAHRYRRYFSESHLDQAYRNIAAMLELDSQMIGLYRHSWFLDPAVLALEPKLEFLLRTPLANGAIHKPVRRILEADLHSVLEHSRTRREAFENGRYEPWEWGYLWPRDALLAWAHGLDLC